MNKRGLNPLILTFFKRLFNIAKNVFKTFKKYFFANWGTLYENKHIVLILLTSTSFVTATSFRVTTYSSSRLCSDS